MSQTASNFANKIAPDAVQACINTGVFPSVVIAQGIEESASGTSKQALLFKNLFGHMASGSWMGKKGQTVPGGKFWRVYDSVLDCIKAHIEILKKPIYRLKGVILAKTPAEQALALQKAGYNTGPDREQYATKLIRIIKAYNLQQYDAQMFAAERKTNPNNLAFNEQSGITKALHNLIG